jgi:hypothetical protein
MARLPGVNEAECRFLKADRWLIPPRQTDPLVPDQPPDATSIGSKIFAERERSRGQSAPPR